MRSGVQKSFVMLLAVLALAAMPVMADSFQVLVAYADSLRASGFFPTPWVGSPNVVFSGQSAPTQLDSGAIRIDNTGATNITIHNLTVVFGGGQTFSLWGDVTLTPGQIGIFDQTAQFNFDSSDFGVFGGAPPTNLEPNNAAGNGNTNLIGGCSSPTSFMTAAQLAACNSFIPVVSFMENGNLVSANDTGHILDTGGYDFLNNSAFGEDGNESINWNNIGGNSRGGNTVPEPSSIALFGSALIGSVALLRRKMRKQP